MATVVALTVSPLALAGLGPNGLGPNGLGPNGLGPNGLGPNGLGPNGLGPNGLGPNGLGPNGLNVNGLNVNGLGPNGLGPNGLNVNGLDVNGQGFNGLGPGDLVLRVTPDGWTGGTSNFRAWFEADPAGAAEYMKYFTRCAYDVHTAIVYVDRYGKTWAWTGQYALAMGSLDSGLLEPLGPGSSQLVRARMTSDEGEWVSACLLAHVNTKGTHQYLSLTGEPSNAKAHAALVRSAGEKWVMTRSLGTFYGDLFAGTYASDNTFQPAPVKYAANFVSQILGTASLIVPVNLVLGRSCDVEDCTYVDKNGVSQHVLTSYNGWAGPDKFGLHVYGNKLDKENLDPTLPDDAVCWGVPTKDPTSIPPYRRLVDCDLWGKRIFRFLKTASINLIEFPSFATPGTPDAVSYRFIDTGSKPVDPVSQIANCAVEQCASGTKADPIAYQKLTGLVDGQELEFTNIVSSKAFQYATTLPPAEVDQLSGQAFTALVRYANAKVPKAVVVDPDGLKKSSTATGNASLRVQTSAADGTYRDAGTEIWPSTGGHDSYDWLYVYPVYAYKDLVAGDGSVRMNIRFSGAASGEACSGAKLLRGDGEDNTCTKAYFDWAKLRFTCTPGYQGGPACRGPLVFFFRARDPGWHCADGGPAVFACNAADAPELDVMGFIPGAPYCAPSGAGSFVGNCK
jgi:hypothetical protein